GKAREGRGTAQHDPRNDCGRCRGVSRWHHAAAARARRHCRSSSLHRERRQGSVRRGIRLLRCREENSVSADNTLFRPGSISKLFTWTAVMQLVEQGKLDLDRDVNDYLEYKIPA